MSNIYKLFLINIVLFVVLIVLYFTLGFLAGYGSNNTYEAAAWRLYAGFIIIHLIINFILLRKMKILSTLPIAFSCIEILILYGVVAWVYR